MPTKGTREAGDDSLASLNTSAEISDKDYAPGMRRKSGQRVKRPEPEAKE